MTLRMFITLVRLTGNTNTRGGRLGRGRIGLWATYLIILVAFMPLAYTLYRAADGLYVTLNSIHQSSAEIGMAVVAAQLFSLLYGLLAAISIAFFATDLDKFISLPIPPWMILTARFVSLWISQLIISLPLVGPVFAVYGIHQGSVGVWISLVLMYIIISVVPLLIAFIISILLMRVTNVGSSRDKLRYISGFVVIIGYVAIRLVGRSRTFQQYNTPGALTTLLTKPDGLLHQIGRYFPPSVWETKAIASPWLSGGLTNWAFSILFSGVLAALLLFLANTLFLSGYIGAGEVSRKGTRAKSSARTRAGKADARGNGGQNSFGATPRTSLTRSDAATTRPIDGLDASREGDVATSARTAAPYPTSGSDIASAASSSYALPERTLSRTLLDTEVRQFFRSPTFTLRAFSSIITMLIVMIFTATKSMSAVNIGQYTAEFSIGAACLMMMLGGFNLVAGTAFTREGSRFHYVKSLPIPTMQWVSAKWLLADLISLLPAIVIVVLEVIFSIPWPAVALSALLGILGFHAVNGLMLWVDMLGPMLDWTNEQQALRGLRVLIFIWGSMALAGALIGLTIWLHAGLHFSNAALYLVMLLLFVVGNILSMWLVRANAERLLQAVE